MSIPPSDPPAPERALAGKVVVLQGATGAVGGRLAERLAAAGVRLALPVREGKQVDELDRRIAAAAGDAGTDEPAPRLVVEVPDAPAAGGFARGTAATLGPPDAFVSCAGTFAFARVGEEADDLSRTVLDANLTAPHMLLRAFVPGFRAVGRGRIVLTGAAAVGVPPSPGMGLYRAAKCGLRALAETLAAELSDGKVGVHVVHPRTIATEANRQAMPDADPERDGWQSVDRVCDALIAAAAGACEGLDVAVDDAAERVPDA